ncbi:ABC transporter substrate-binding protein [Paenibacillus sp. OV219]|uniref:ABC transporter substrate-binding protein n=1 Tax=Paenibacillus sp. OV219 TaxID=1884377 RepID=UPI0008C58BB5|nr:ABC transporter substrate-binding protein [Paenibacillus sp. OV219]SEO52244.1 carbohydrate ABC transporter substrate-binding protein, CUT1 family [Paenibacillus sp. OV219]
MKPTVKKLSTLAIAGAMTVGLLAGCGNAETNENGTPKANDTAANETSKQEKVVVDFWSIWDPGNGNGKLLADAAAKFNSENLDTEIVVSGQGGYDGVAEKLEAALVAKKPPVIAQIEESFIARYSPVAADLSKYVSKATIDNYIDGLTVSSIVDGVFKAAPLNRSTPILYLNADLLAKAGLSKEGPKTWDELYEFAKKMAKPDQGIYGFSGHWDSDAWFWESALYSYGGEVVNEDGSEAAFDNDKGSKIVELWQKMSNEKVMLNPYSSQGNVSDIVKQNFVDGKVGMILDSVGSMGPLLKDQSKFKVQVAYQPAGEKNSIVTGGANMIILDSATEEQKKAAGKFLEYLASDEFVVNFYKTSGYFATTKSSLETKEVKDLFAEHPQFKVAIDQLQFAHKRPWQKNWRAMYTSIVDDLNGAMVDTKSDAKAIIHTADVKAQKIMDDNK